MTKLNELKAAYEASPGLLKCDADALDSRVFAFMCQAEALMPQLLEAAEVLKAVVPLMDIAFNYDGDVFGRQHNNATDVYSAAECVLRGLK